MLHAVSDAFREREITVDFGVDPMEKLSFNERRRLNMRYLPSLLSLVPGRRVQRRVRALAQRLTLLVDPHLSAEQKNSLGLISRSECDAFIDISGYRYGDYWSIQHARVFSQLAQFYHRRRKPVILLPQMFGSFQQRNVIRALRPGFEAATLIYAREQESFDAMRAAFTLGPKLRCVPDITIPLVANSLIGDPSRTGRRCAIVPNYRMLGSRTGGEAYRRFLLGSFKFLDDMNMRPVFVIHESTGNDRKIAEGIVNQVGGDCEKDIREDKCPRQTKAFLARQNLIVSSRFHACVAGLSMGVPVLTYGWAHKYDALHRDFGEKSVHAGFDQSV